MKDILSIGLNYTSVKIYLRSLNDRIMYLRTQMKKKKKKKRQRGRSGRKKEEGAIAESKTKVNEEVSSLYCFSRSKTGWGGVLFFRSFCKIRGIWVISRTTKYGHWLGAMMMCRPTVCHKAGALMGELTQMANHVMTHSCEP